MERRRSSIASWQKYHRETRCGGKRCSRPTEDQFPLLEEFDEPVHNRLRAGHLSEGTSKRSAAIPEGTVLQ